MLIMFVRLSVFYYWVFCPFVMLWIYTSLCFPGGLSGQFGVLPVLHHGQLLLAAGGGPVPAHPAYGLLL